MMFPSGQSAGRWVEFKCKEQPPLPRNKKKPTFPGETEDVGGRNCFGRGYTISHGIANNGMCTLRTSIVALVWTTVNTSYQA